MLRQLGDRSWLAAILIVACVFALGCGSADENAKPPSPSPSPALDGTEKSLVVVGYSFGSRCALHYSLRDADVSAMVAIGFPVRLEDLSDEVRSLGRPLAVVQGNNDEFGSPDEVRATIDGADPAPRLFVVDGADHLFTGRAGEAAELVVKAAAALLDGVSR